MKSRIHLLPIKYQFLFVVTVFILLMVVTTFTTHAQGSRRIRVGIFTDCQYCDCSPDDARNYRLSLSKIDSCVQVFNAMSLDAVFHLGDMIDRDYDSYDSVLVRFKKFHPPVNMVLGNHDYMIPKKYRPGLMGRLGMKSGYYTVDLDDWRVIVLNGDDLSFYAPQGKQQKSERNDIVVDQFQQFKLSGMPWNGGIGSVQMDWLKQQLDQAEKDKKKVVVACHFPLFGKSNHVLFNHTELFDLISGYGCVKAYFNGHYHKGNYHFKRGIHLVNFRGMVDTDSTAFALVTLTADSILIRGYGREPDRQLKIRLSAIKK